MFFCRHCCVVSFNLITETQLRVYDVPPTTLPSIIKKNYGIVNVIYVVADGSDLAAAGICLFPLSLENLLTYVRCQGLAQNSVVLYINTTTSRIEPALLGIDGARKHNRPKGTSIGLIGNLPHMPCCYTFLGINIFTIPQFRLFHKRNNFQLR